MSLGETPRPEALEEGLLRDYGDDASSPRTNQ